MSAGDKALRNTIVHLQKAQKFCVLALSDKRIAMEHDSLRRRVSPRRLPTNEHLAP